MQFRTDHRQDSILARIMQAFCALHRITYSAPWLPTQRCGR